MSCRRLPLGVVASRLLRSNCRTGRVRLWARTGSRCSGPAGLNAGSVSGSRLPLRLRGLASLLACVVSALLAGDGYGMGRSKHVLALVPRAGLPASHPKHILALVPRSRPADSCPPAPVSTPFALPPDALALASMNAKSAYLPAVNQAIELVRRRKISQATDIEKSVRDPMARNLVEWVILRSDDSGADFDRYAAFIQDHPGWPSLGLLRRRAEGALWQERRNAVTVRRFLVGKPTSARGRLALARVLLNEGDRSGAEREVRETWRSEELSARLETEVLAVFPDFVTLADHAERMDRRIGSKDFMAALRAAVRLGRPYVSIVNACEAAMAKASNARALLEKVPSEIRKDLGYTLCRIHWLLRNNGVAEAARLMLAAPRDAMPRQDTDQWWRERRVRITRLPPDIPRLTTASSRAPSWASATQHCVSRRSPIRVTAPGLGHSM